MTTTPEAKCPDCVNGIVNAFGGLHECLRCKPKPADVAKVRRITVTWRDGAYYVTEPCWDGGDVVDAVAYDLLLLERDALAAKVEQLQSHDTEKCDPQVDRSYTGRIATLQAELTAERERVESARVLLTEADDVLLPVARNSGDAIRKASIIALGIRIARWLTSATKADEGEQK